MSENSDNVKAPETPSIPDKPVDLPVISAEVPLVDLPGEAEATHEVDAPDELLGPIRLNVRRYTAPEPYIPDYILEAPIMDAARTDQQVMEDLQSHDPLNPVRMFFDTIKGAEGSMRNRQDIMFQQRATFFLNYLVFPYIEGYAKAKGITAEEQIASMISSNQSMGFFFQGEGREQLMQALRTPRILSGTMLIRPFFKMDESVIREQTPWWLERIKETRGEYYRVIAKYGSSGHKWLADSLVDCFAFIKGILGA